MRQASAAVLCAALLIVGCGGTSKSSPPRVTQPATTPRVGEGCMGACRPTLHVGLVPSTPRGRPHIPDVSEFQPPVTGHVPTVIRLYEAGDNQRDANAAINAYRLRSWHVWFGGYSFLRPGSCTAQADRTVQIIHRIGGLSGPVIADAEVPLPAGFVRCFTSRVHRLLPRYPVGTYTSCGTVSEVVLPLWVADYGVLTPCTPFGDPFEAWQYVNGAWCGERVVTDCSLDYGITSLKPGRSTREVHRLIALWTAQRRSVLHRYHDADCKAWSRGPRCTAWRHLEHELYLDIRRLEG
jgi:hypothetical protein